MTLSRCPTYLVCFLFLFLASCTSLDESIDALWEIHSPHDKDSILVERKYGRFLTYTDTIGEKTINDPVDFCLEHIEDIADASLSREITRFKAIHALSLSALRSPAAKVRCSAVRSMRKIYSEQVTRYQRSVQATEPDLYAEKYGRMVEIFNSKRIPESAPDVWMDEYLPLLQYFTIHRPIRLDYLWQVISELFKHVPVADLDDPMIEAFNEAALRLGTQLTLLTVHQAQMDPDAQVRQEAIDLFFLFPWETVRFYLPEWADYLQAPSHQIKIMDHILDKKDRPDTIDVAVVSVARKVLLNSINAGEHFHAIRLLQTLTGKKEAERDFWIDWCKQFVLEHAGKDESVKPVIPD